MSATMLDLVLKATGYLIDDQPAPGVHLGDSARRLRRERVFSPDALWRSPSTLTVYFKAGTERPTDELVALWRREIWNEGFAPLLWVISPACIELYNGFGRPRQTGDAAEHRLHTFQHIQESLAELDSIAGRLAMETGQFWLHAQTVDRKTGVDKQLLSDIASLERDLVVAGLDRPQAQGLIGRSVFTQYLIDRKIVTSRRLLNLCGHSTLPPILRDREAAKRLSKWLEDTFNGDIFSSFLGKSSEIRFLKRVADFLEMIDPATGQTTLFPYQFDIIPVELLSSIYEQFAHMDPGPSRHTKHENNVAKTGVHYTPLPMVSMVLDEVMDGLTGRETVLDLTCGSGVFLVEALRRLVRLRSGRKDPTRELIRATLYEQIYGVDISEAAIRVAAFSLYLAALELDPNPQPPSALRFRPLIDRTLFVADARNVSRTPASKVVLVTPSGLKAFDVIVGNPPWSYRGRLGTAERRNNSGRNIPAQPRGEALDFVVLAEGFAHARTRIGMILSATPFFSRKGTAAAQHVVRLLSPVTLIDLSALSPWLFPSAKMPAVALFARHRPQRDGQMTVVHIPWSPTGAKTHTFEIIPGDITTLLLADWQNHPTRLKTAAFGGRRDLLLLESLNSSYRQLGESLAAIGAELRDGLIEGNDRNQTRDSTEIRGLEVLRVKDMGSFKIPAQLPRFTKASAQWPRSRAIYRSPLLLVKEFLIDGPRAVAAVANRDLVYTDAYFGAALPPEHVDAAYLLAGICSSALASWFFLMTASEFGLWKRRLLREDLMCLPTPDLVQAVHSKAGVRVVAVVRELQTHAPQSCDWTQLDDAVFNLYGLDKADRVVARDGLARGELAWKPGREASAQPARTHEELEAYARTFLMTIDAWLSARKVRRMCAEILDLPRRDALRIIRFVVEEESGPSAVRVVQPNAQLREIIVELGDRLKVRLASALTGERELRVYGRDEVVIIKPAARRHWMGVSALEDADAILADSFARGSE